MEFFIKKNATLPILKMQVVKDGRSDFNKMMGLIENSAIFFSMVDIETGIPKITTRPAGFVSKKLLEPNADPEYYVYYQFTNKDTRKVGRYEGQFLLRNEDGVLILPIRDKLFINIQESFIAEDLPYDSCYVSEFPCCILPTPTPSPTPTPNPTPIVTTTTTLQPLPLEVVLNVIITPGSTIIDYNLTSNIPFDDPILVYFNHTLNVYTGSPINIITGVTISVGEIFGITQVILEENFNNLTRIDTFSNIITYPSPLNLTITENYPVTPTPTPTPIDVLINPIITENDYYIIIGDNEYLEF